MLYFPPDVKAMFTGEEQEGDDKGTYTLFVVSEVEIKDLKNAIDKLYASKRNVRQLYLGAGFLSKVTPEYIQSVAQAFDDEPTYNDVSITIEASYFDARTLVACPRIGKWIYTAMMLDAVNPNYHNTMALFNSPPLLEGYGLNENLLGKIFIKMDFAKTTLVVPFHQHFYSRYQDYSGDTLLACNSSETPPPVPYPIVRQISSDPESFADLDLSVFVMKSDAYELKAGWAPSKIFRSK